MDEASEELAGVVFCVHGLKVQADGQQLPRVDLGKTTMAATTMMSSMESLACAMVLRVTMDLMMQTDGVSSHEGQAHKDGGGRRAVEFYIAIILFFFPFAGN